MTKYELWNLIISGTGLFAAIGVVIVAVWGEPIKQFFTRPKLAIKILEPIINTTADGKRGWYFGFKVINKRNHHTAINARVQLIEIYKKVENDTWIQQKFSGPLQVDWRWPEMPLYINIGPENYATFAKLLEYSDKIELCLKWYPNNLNPNIYHIGTTRCVFELVSDNAKAAKITIEIKWDGKWTDDSIKLKEHLKIKKIKQEKTKILH